MARKPIQVERTGHRTPRERMWGVMQQLGRFQAALVEDAAHPAGRGAVQSYVEGLCKAGFIRALESAPFRRTTWEVVKRQAQAPMLDRKGNALKPALGTLAMWRAMKVRKVFNADEIAADATQGGVSCSRGTAKSYLAALLRCGYLKVDVKSKPGTLARLRLVMDTGPLAPAITRAKVVFDRNTGAMALLDTAQEVGDGLDR